MTERQAILNYISRNDLISFAPRAVLIDMDGTLYDSMPHHADAWYRLMTEAGVECECDEFFMYEGRTGRDTIDILFKRQFGHGATPEESERLYRHKTELFSDMPSVSVMPGAQRMVNECIRFGLDTVLVTGSGQRTLIDRLDIEFPGAFPPERRITSADVNHGKPHPEPYLRAMALAGCGPENSIAIDNAPIGVMSGSASGAFTIGVVTGPIPEAKLYEAGADIVYSSMPLLAERLPILLNSFNTSL